MADKFTAVSISAARGAWRVPSRTLVRDGQLVPRVATSVRQRSCAILRGHHPELAPQSPPWGGGADAAGSAECMWRRRGWPGIDRPDDEPDRSVPNLLKCVLTPGIGDSREAVGA